MKQNIFVILIIMAEIFTQNVTIVFAFGPPSPGTKIPTCGEFLIIWGIILIIRALMRPAELEDFERTPTKNSKKI